VTTSGTRGSECLADGVVLVVDTHLDFHVAVVLDRLGRRLGEVMVPTTGKGYGELLLWTEGFGLIRCVCVGGTGSYRASLARLHPRHGRYADSCPRSTIRYQLVLSLLLTLLGSL
jgi:hypothetical protein